MQVTAAFAPLVFPFQKVSKCLFVNCCRKPRPARHHRPPSKRFGHCGLAQSWFPLLREPLSNGHSRIGCHVLPVRRRLPR